MDKLWKRALWTLLGVIMFAGLSLIDEHEIVRLAEEFLGVHLEWMAPYRLSLGFLLVPAFAYIFGAVSAALVGSLGLLVYWVLYDHLDWEWFLQFLPRMLGMALGAAALGLALGALFRVARQWEGRWVRLLLSLAAAVVACALGLWLVTSLVDSQLLPYSFQMTLRRNQGWALQNGALVLLGVPVGMAVRPSRGSGDTEDFINNGKEE